MKIFIRAKHRTENFINCRIQLHLPLLNIDLQGEWPYDGFNRSEVDGPPEKVHWLFIANGASREILKIEDGDQINIKYQS